MGALHATSEADCIIRNKRSSAGTGGISRPSSTNLSHSRPYCVVEVDPLVPVPVVVPVPVPVVPVVPVARSSRCHWSCRCYRYSSTPSHQSLYRA